MDEILTIQVRSFKVGFEIFTSQIQFKIALKICCKMPIHLTRFDTLYTFFYNNFKIYTIQIFILCYKSYYPRPHLWTFGSYFMRSMLREFCCKSHFISSPHSRGRPLLSYSCSSQYKTIYYHRCQICRKMVEKEHDQKYGKRAAVKRLLRCVM